jgi:predicted dehydrogenase
MSHVSRRRFLEDSMFAAAAAVAAGPLGRALADDAPQSASPNEKLSVAVIGVNGQGNNHLGAYTSRKDTQVTYICDADKKVGMQRVAQTAERQGHAPKYVQDLRRVFEDKTVDIVSIAMPNHWHALAAIWAMQAGKDVYVEKPVSHNISEGRRMIETARKHSKICQTGTQCRSMGGTIEAIDWVHSGKIGELKIARGLCYKHRGSIGPKGVYAVPANIDYNLWTGPAPLKPPARNGEHGPVHYDWHWFWDYGNGDLGNQGIHQMDIARWGLGVDALPTQVLSYGGRLGYEDAGETANTQVIIHDYGPKTLVFEVRGLKTDALRGAKVGVIFEGTDGYVVLTSYTSGAAFDASGHKVKDFRAGGDHFGNFLKAVRSRKVEDLHADILEGHLSSALCHLGNISYRLGSKTSMQDAEKRLSGNGEAVATFQRFSRHLADNGLDLKKVELGFGKELRFDPKAEKFVDNSLADQMLTRVYRAPFIVPAAGQV